MPIGLPLSPTLEKWTPYSFVIAIYFISLRNGDFFISSSVERWGWGNILPKDLEEFTL